MNLSQLHYFIVAAQLKHYGRASKTLYITQPALSNAIARLEEELGVKLFERSGRNVVLTDSGEVFRKHISVALAEINQAVSAVSMQAGGSDASVKIGAVAAIMRGLLSSLIGAYNENTKEKIDADISQKGSTSECIAELKKGTCDIAFGGYPVGETQFEWVPLWAERIVCAVSNQHPLFNQEEISFDDIVGYPLLSYREPSYMYYALRGLFQEKNVFPIQAFEDEISALSVIATKEHHVAIMLDTIQDVIWDSIKLLTISDFKLPYHWIGLIYKKDHTYSQPVDSFINYLKDYSSSLAFIEPSERLYYRD